MVQERLVDIGGTLAGVDKRQKVTALPLASICLSYNAITLRAGAEEQRDGIAKAHACLGGCGFCVPSKVASSLQQNRDQSGILTY